MSEFSENFRIFWEKEYIPYHKDKSLRIAHLAASGLSFYLLARFLVEFEVLSLLLIPLFHTGIIFAAHKIVAENYPLQWQEPLMASLADARLFLFWLAGASPYGSGDHASGGVSPSPAQAVAPASKTRPSQSKSSKSKSTRSKTAKSKSAATKPKAAPPASTSERSGKDPVKLKENASGNDSAAKQGTGKGGEDLSYE